jgi:capsular exopolysaccharide synthesis family protein
MMTGTQSLDFSVLLSRKKTLFVSGLIAAALAFLVSRTLPLRYISEGGMVMENATEGTVAPDEGIQLVQTQIDVLTSAGLIRRIVQTLHLDQIPDLEPAFRLPAGVTAWATTARDYVQAALKSTAGSGPAPEDPTARTVALIQKLLQVEAKDHSKLVTVRLVAGSPDVAARVVNAIMEEYVSSDADVRNHKIATINAYIAQQSKAMTTDIEAALQKLLAFLEKNNLPEVGGGSTAALQLSRDEEQLAIARDQLALRQAAFDTMSHGGSVQGAEETLESQTIQTLKSYEAQITQQIGSLSPIDPRRNSLQAGLNSIRAQLSHENDLIYASVARNVAIARAKVQALETAVRIGSARSQDVSKASAEQRQLSSDLDAKRQVYLAFLTHAEQLRTEAEGSASAHILFQAVPPKEPVSTYGTLSVIIGFLGGIFLCAGTLVLRDAFGTRVHTTTELELVTGLPVFGSLPDIKQLERGGAFLMGRGNASATIETLRAMWIWMRSERKEHTTTLVVTSSEHGEGKSTVVTALAQSLAEDGFNVLLIDADLRRPNVATILKLRATHFIESVLANEVTAEQAIIRDTRFGFDCLLSDGSSRNPAKILLSEEFRQLLTASRQAYDFVLLDSPPVLQVVDPVLISELCDHIVFVVQAGRLSGDLVEEATRRFKDAERKKILMFLTQVRARRMDKRDYFGGYTYNADRRLQIR